MYKAYASFNSLSEQINNNVSIEVECTNSEVSQKSNNLFYNLFISLYAEIVSLDVEFKFPPSLIRYMSYICSSWF